MWKTKLTNEGNLSKVRKLGTYELPSHLFVGFFEASFHLVVLTVLELVCRPG